MDRKVGPYVKTLTGPDQKYGAIRLKLGRRFSLISAGNYFRWVCSSLNYPHYVVQKVVLVDGVVLRPKVVMPDSIRHPEGFEFTGFRLSPE